MKKKMQRAATPRKLRCRKCSVLRRSLSRSFMDYAVDTERLSNALRRIKGSLAQFDSHTYAAAAAYGGQVLLMRQTVEAALNPSRAKPPAGPGAVKAEQVVVWCARHECPRDQCGGYQHPTREP